MVSRGPESCLVDLVIDRAPVLDPNKRQVGGVRLDTLRELAADKVSTLIARSEVRTLVDLKALLDGGISLEQALQDAQVKDAGADAATLAFTLDQVKIGAEARLPAGTDPVALERFREELVVRLRRLAYPR